MTPFSERFKEEVRDRVDILDVISRHVKLRKSGTNWMGLCPFHDDRKSPSFSVQPEKGVFHCFGCGAGGDVFEFVMRMQGLGFQDALEQLAAEVNLPLPERGAPPSPEASREKDERRQLLNLMAEVKAWFQANLRGSQGREAQGYLAARGLQTATVERFQLGYALPGWNTLLDRFGGGQAACHLLEKAGLAVRRDNREAWYDRFRDRIIFPIHDRQGRCIAFGGRVLRPAGNDPKYINSPETPLYRKGEVLYGWDLASRAIGESETALVVEGYMDLIALVDAGLANVVATLGTAMTEQHLRLLWTRAKRVVFSFDGDKAGRKAAWRALEQVMEGLEADRHPLFLFLPEGQDPDAFVRRDGIEAFRQRMREATPLLDFLMNHLSEDLAADTPEGKAALVRRVEPFLARVADPLLRKLYTEAMHRRLGLEGVWQTPRPRKPPARRVGPLASTPRGLGDGRDHERVLLSILLRHPTLIPEHEESFAGLMIENPLRARLLDALIRMAHQTGSNAVRPLDGLHDPDVRHLAEEILNIEELELGNPQQELEGCLTNCHLTRVRREMDRLLRAGFKDEKELVVYHGYRLEEDRLLRDKRVRGALVD